MMDQQAIMAAYEDKLEAIRQQEYASEFNRQIARRRDDLIDIIDKHEAIVNRAYQELASLPDMEVV